MIKNKRNKGLGEKKKKKKETLQANRIIQD